MHFDTKNYLKSTRNHTAKHALSPMYFYPKLPEEGFLFRCAASKAINTIINEQKQSN
jgi:hypothetical protein